MKYLLLSFLLLSINILCAQVQTRHRQKLSGIPIYHKQTNKRLTDQEFLELQKNHPGIVPQPQINKFGQVEALYVDPVQIGMVNIRDASLRVKPGEVFPPFVMKTLNGEKLDSEEFKGKLILIHCQIFVKSPFFKEKALKKVTELVKNLKIQTEVEFILLTESEPNEIDQNLFQSDQLQRIVPASRNFMIRYQVSSSPCNILVDAAGKLVSYYDALEFEKLKLDTDSCILYK